MILIQQMIDRREQGITIIDSFHLVFWACR
jgi:hypothetical protein